MSPTKKPDVGQALSRRPSAGLADLLRWVVRPECTPESADRGAMLLGFERRVDEDVQRNGATSLQLAGHARIKSSASGSLTVSPPSTTLWYAVVERRGAPPAAPGEPEHGPVCLRGVAPLTGAQLQPAASRPLLPMPPLAPWARLWPWLKAALASLIPGDLDIARLTERLARAELPPRLPRRERAHWSPAAQVLLDYSLRLYPFRDDYDSLCRELVRLRGALGLQILRLEDRPGGRVRRWRRHEEKFVPWKIPPAGSCLLIGADLGLNDGENSALLADWLEFGQRLQRAGVRATVLAPVSPEHIPATARAVFDIVCLGQPGPPIANRHRGPAREQAALARLRCVLSPALRVEPDLLRKAARLAAPGLCLGGLEAAYWSEHEARLSRVPRAPQPPGAADGEQMFADLPLVLQWAGLDLLTRAHAHLHPAVLHEEVLAWAAIAAPAAVAARQAAVDRAADFFLAAAADFYADTGQLAETKQHYARRHVTRAPDGRACAYLNVLYAAAWRDELLGGAAMPADPRFDSQEILSALSAPGARPQTWRLAQSGDVLWLLPRMAESQALWQRDYSPLAELELRVPLVEVQSLAADGRPRNVPLAREPVNIGSPAGGLWLRTGRDALRVGGFARPAWAKRIWRDAGGLHACVQWCGREHEFVWREGMATPGWQALEAGPVGFDRFGLYAEFSVGKVVQRCRWIAPGSFRMGSPPDEAERGDNETLHEVTLTRGYWLADTACTQALWQAVMGNNPGNFQDDPLNPVEQVSWLQVQKFLVKLNTRVPGLDAALPTEAQWEYACRAGTQTPFSFGGNVTPEQVNYDGGWPYAGGRKGEDRRKTVPVASLPPNDWGLYEMHGNVWEWCADWYGELSRDPATDPAGPAEGAGRVLRGGAWFSSGRDCRSACRDGYGPGSRSHSIGFRLAPGQIQQARQAGPQADGQGQAEPAPGQAAGGPAGQARRRQKKKG